MPKRAVFGTLLATGALALLLSFKTPAATGQTNPGSTQGTSNRGTYSGQLTGSSIQTPYGPVQVQLTLTSGKITEITVLQIPTGGRDSQITAYAEPQLRSEVLNAQSAQVDTISGATYTSQGYLQSVQSALDQAGSVFTGATGATVAQAGATTDPNANSGSNAGATAAATTATKNSHYSGTVTGQAVQIPFGTVQVQVTIVSGKITDVVAIALPGGGRSGQIAQYAAPQLRSEVLATQSANVDTISGATYTSQGYMQSVQSALDQAGI